MSRALVFKGEYTFEAFYEILQVDDEVAKRLRSEKYVGRSPDALVGQINWMNRRFGMTRDLLNDPDVVYRVEDTSEGSVGVSYVHVGVVPDGQDVAFQYHLTPFNAPYSLGISRNLPEANDQCRLVRISKPPREVLGYLKQALQNF